MQLLVRNKVMDFECWKAVADTHPHSLACDAAGMSLRQLWRGTEDPNPVFMLFDIADEALARAYMADPAGADAGERAGVLDGECHFLQCV